ncbi:hypothetical protein WJX84_010186 [Apatococcus fuscideae]|uniref:Uncharacterized protein n=1 Tax=Apatococcus fuscideae TaxID=2026836 RepID=A0AAW1SYF5_9CHLO
MWQQNKGIPLDRPDGCAGRPVLGDKGVAAWTDIAEWVVGVLLNGFPYSGGSVPRLTWPKSKRLCCTLAQDSHDSEHTPQVQSAGSGANLLQIKYNVDKELQGSLEDIQRAAISA